MKFLIDPSIWPPFVFPFGEDMEQTQTSHHIPWATTPAPCSRHGCPRVKFPKNHCASPWADTPASGARTSRSRTSLWKCRTGPGGCYPSSWTCRWPQYPPRWTHTRAGHRRGWEPTKANTVFDRQKCKKKHADYLREKTRAGEVGIEIKLWDNRFGHPCPALGGCGGK